MIYKYRRILGNISGLLPELVDEGLPLPQLVVIPQHALEQAGGGGGEGGGGGGKELEVKVAVVVMVGVGVGV